MNYAANLARNVVFYHQSDIDGRVAGYIAKRAIVDADSSVEMVPFNYQEIDGFIFHTMFPEAINAIFVDCSPKKYEAKAIIDGGVKVIIIDHHKTANEEFDEVFRAQHKGNLLTRIDDNWCGAVLAFKYFYPELEVPPVLQLVDTYDMWQNKSKTWKKAEDLNNCLMLNSWEVDEPMWEHLIFGKGNEAHIAKLVKEGKSITQTLRLEYTRIAKKDGGTMHWEGVDFFVLNTPLGNSKAVGFAPEKGKHQAILLYHYSPHACRWVISMYHMTDRLEWDGDLSHIAKKYGGGGHAGACGFSCTDLPFDLATIEPIREVHPLFKVL